MAIFALMRLLFVLLSLALSMTPLWGAQLSLREALKQALTANRSLPALRSRVEESAARVEQVRAAYLPQFRFGGSYTYLSRIPKISLTLPPPAKSPDIKTATHHVLDASLSGSYLLFDFGRRKRLLQQSETGKRLAETALGQAEVEVAYQVMKLYATASLQGALVELSRRYVVISQKHFDDAKVKFENGLLSQFDLLKSELQLKTYQEQFAIAEVDRQLALMQLGEACGADTGDVIEPAELIQLLSFRKPVSSFYDSLIAAKPQIRGLRLQQDVADLAAANEQLRPTLTATSSAGWKNNYMPDTDRLEFNYVGALVLSYQLFDGGLVKHRRAEEHQKRHTQQAEIERLSAESLRRTQVLAQELSKIEARIVIAMEKMTVAQKALQIASVSYGAGLITNSDYLDTELEVQKIETESLQNRHALLLNQLELKRELGYFPEVE